MDAMTQDGTTSPPAAPAVAATPEANAANPPNAADPNAQARQGWLATAGGDAAKPQAAAPGPQTTSTPAGQLPQQPMQTMPVPVTSMKRGGLLGVVDSIVDVLAGKQRPELGKDPDGNLYVKQHTLTRGEQWLKIAAEGFQGASAGLAAGRGRGNMGKAGLAGFEAGQQDADREKTNEQDMNNQVRQQKLDQANNQMLQMQMAEHTWNATRLQVKANEDDYEWEEKMTKELTGADASFLGTTAHAGDINHILEAHPGVMKSLVGYKGTEQDLAFVPHFEDGKAAGFSVYRTQPGYFDEKLPAGAVFHVWDPANQVMQEVHASAPMTRREQMAYDTAAYNDKTKAENDGVEQGLKKAQTSEANATASEGPSKIRQQNAEANAANARADATRSGAQLPDGTPNPRFEAMAQALYDGDLLPADLKREAKGAGLDPNEIMGRAVQIGNEKGKPWSESIIKEEQRFAESPKTQAALDGINRVIDPKSGYVKQMLDRAEAAHIGTNGLYNSAELSVRRFFGEDTAKNFNTSVTELRRSIAGLIGNPLLGGSETDKKLEQADELIGQKPTLENLRSASETLNTALRAQKQSIIGNNRFLEKRYGENAGQAPAQQPAVVHVNPGEPTAKAADGSTLVVRNGQWVPAQP